MATHDIGEWRFDPVSGELRSNGECRRLEPRAARTLELLCEAAGELVPQERIIAEVWNGRSLSDNSVSIVIGQLRRALGDEARRSRLIETVPKRGYRLVVGDAPARARPRQAILWAGILAAAAVLAALLWAATERASERPVIAVADVVNATGEPGYDPLARATSELIVAELAGRGFDLTRGGEGGDLAFASRLVMWNGQPSLGMTATDAGGVVRWSAMTNGSADRVPAGVDAELDRFEREIAAR